LVKYWVFAVSEENWFVIKEKYVYGVPESSKAVELVKPGDVAVFYVKKKGSKKLGGKFVGAFSVISNWIPANLGKPIPEEDAKLIIYSLK